MKNKISKIFLWLSGFAVVIVVLNFQSTTRQGVDYNVRTMKIPLYLKILDFFDRHYNYKTTVKRIIGDLKGDEEKALRIYEWTHRNIRENPPGYPVIDDHVWHIIVRGYGVDDQSNDVFSTLCNYAGLDAFYDWVNIGNQDRIALSFVKINRLWRIFDPYNGVYFKNKKGELASIEDVLSGNWQVQKLDALRVATVDYNKYLSGLRAIKGTGFLRANIQSPLRRLLYQLKRWLRYL